MRGCEAVYYLREAWKNFIRMRSSILIRYNSIERTSSRPKVSFTDHRRSYSGLPPGFRSIIWEAKVPDFAALAILLLSHRAGKAKTNTMRVILDD